MSRLKEFNLSEGYDQENFNPIIGYTLLGFDQLLRGVRFNSKLGGGGSRPYPSYEEFQAGLDRADAERKKWFEDLNSRNLNEVSDLVNSTNHVINSIQNSQKLSLADKLLLLVELSRTKI